MEGNRGRRNYLGVRGLKSGNWQARIRDPDARTLVKLGTFKNVEEAAMAYDEAALRLHKDRARLNFPDRNGKGQINYRGVYMMRPGKWIAEIYDLKLIFLGSFSTPEAAALAYDEAALRLKGSRAWLNFPERVYGSQSSTGALVSPPSQQDLQDLDSDGSVMSLLMASLENPESDTWDMDVNYNAISEKQMDPLSQQPPEDGLQAVHHDGGKIMIKVYKDDMIIKFELSISSTKLELEEKVAARLKLPVGSFDLRYQDEDNDWISITCDEDLKTCMNTNRSFGNVSIIRMKAVRY